MATGDDVKEDESEPPTTDTTENGNGILPFQTIRIILAGLAMTGAAESLYLTFNKVFSSPGAICATEGCLDVLSGPFSTFFGIPLSLLGSLSYAMFAYLCIWPLASEEEAAEKMESTTQLSSQLSSMESDNHSDASNDSNASGDIYKRRDAATRPLLLALATSHFVFSSYLVFLLKFVIKSMCPFCLFSAVISATLFILTAFVGRAVPKWQTAGAITAASTVFATLIASISLMTSWPAHILAQPPSEPQTPPAITASSTSDMLRIARKLQGKDAKMYGAYWCKHCFDQKQRFGKKAFAMLQYVECDRFGVKSQAPLCRQKRIPGYPTWEIDGELFPGEIDLPELERLVDQIIADDATKAQTK